MSYEREFCGLSEYVQLYNVRSIIKSTVWKKRDRVDFGLSSLEIKSTFMVILGCLMSYLTTFILLDRSKFSNFKKKVSWFQLFVYIFQKFVNQKLIKVIQNHINTWDCVEATRSLIWFYYINLPFVSKAWNLKLWPLASRQFLG